MAPDGTTTIPRHPSQQLSVWAEALARTQAVEHHRGQLVGRGFEVRVVELVRVVILTNEALDHQIATIESVGLTRRFDDARENDVYTSHAYA